MRGGREAAPPGDSGGIGGGMERGGGGKEEAVGVRDGEPPHRFCCRVWVGK